MIGRRSLGTRSEEPELLDGGGLTGEDLSANLRDIARLNRLPGGSGASVAAIRGLLPAHGGSVLDVGTGAGDLPRLLVRRVPGAVVTAVDVDPAIVELARAWTAPAAPIRYAVGDGRGLAFVTEAFHVAHASLLVHHLEPREVVMVLGELQRVSRQGVVVNDLRRGLVPYLATVLVTRAFARSRVTHLDGPLSVRRAYTLHELDDLAAEAGLRPTARSMSLMPRVVTVYR